MSGYVIAEMGRLRAAIFYMAAVCKIICYIMMFVNKKSIVCYY